MRRAESLDAHPNPAEAQWRWRRERSEPVMMWMWLSIIVVLVGAELNSEIEHQTAHDSTVGLAKPLGVRGAVMADTVGAGVP
jgi:hypothetical protein